MSKTVGEHLVELKARSGLSLAEIARLAGYKGSSSLQRYFSAAFDPEALDYRTAQRLAEAMEGAGDPPINQFDLMALTAAVDREGNRPESVPVQLDKETKGFIPIFEAKLVSYEIEIFDTPDIVDALQIDRSDPIESLRCPPVLERRDVFGFYMAGLSMRPRFNQGEVVFTDGRRPASIGDDILVLMNEPIEKYEISPSIFGKLKDIEKDGFVVEQYLGPTFPVPFRSVSDTRRVMQAHELLGGYII